MRALFSIVLSVLLIVVLLSGLLLSAPRLTNSSPEPIEPADNQVTLEYEYGCPGCETAAH
jgi:hypothetical protein